MEASYLLLGHTSAQLYHSNRFSPLTLSQLPQPELKYSSCTSDQLAGSRLDQSETIANPALHCEGASADPDSPRRSADPIFPSLGSASYTRCAEQLIPPLSFILTTTLPKGTRGWITTFSSTQAAIRCQHSTN